jgi:two-component system, OmpR family, phosphate regulon sensor histidine kinase PhoR
MLYPVLMGLLLMALLIHHLWWRSRLSRVGLEEQKRLAAAEQNAQRVQSELQTRQAALFNSMSEGVLVLDEQQRVLMANHAFISFFGLAGEVKGKTLLQLVRLHEVAHLAERAAQEGHVAGYELKLVFPAERCLEINGAAIGEESGKRQGLILVFHDLTRVKKLERTREEFVANVSHELRTPLSLIKGYVETLRDGAKENPELAEKFLQTIDRNAERLRLIIEDLLTISELESGRLKLDLQPLALRPLVEKLVNDFKAQAEARHVKLETELPSVQVRADPLRLEQALGNLVDNAIKYGGSGGEVQVSARPLEDGFVEISVKDNGPGIPADALDRVFERFYRVDKSRSREQGGTGLGLAIVKHIIQTHGGRVWAISQPGQGAQFCLTLPAAGGA